MVKECGECSIKGKSGKVHQGPEGSRYEKLWEREGEVRSVWMRGWVALRPYEDGEEC